jgi:hypothetical protein
MKISLVSKALPFILVVSVLNPSSAGAFEVSPALYVKGDCHLTIENAHISKYLLKRNINPVRAIKANVTSECIYPQQKVIVQIWILKKVNGDWVHVKGFIRFANGPFKSPYKIEFQDSWIACKKRKLTWYLIQARAWVTIGGKEYASEVGVSQNPKQLFCSF